MAKSQDTFSKKEKEKKRLQKRKEKEQKKAERKANTKQGQSLEEMMAYVDENGNISDTPPDPTKKKKINEEDIVLGSRNREGMEVVTTRKGKVTYFNSAKGYGFIKDLISQESIFVHVNSLSIQIKENDLVAFETEQSVKGLSAKNVRKA